MNKCNKCPRKASCTIEPSTCYAPTNYTISLSKVKTEKEIRADERAKTIDECKKIVMAECTTTCEYPFFPNCVECMTNKMEQLKEQKNEKTN